MSQTPPTRPPIVKKNGTTDAPGEQAGNGTTVEPPVRPSSGLDSNTQPPVTATASPPRLGQQVSPASPPVRYEEPQRVDFPERVWRGAGVAWETCFGAVAMIVALAVLATIPVLNLLSLGYLLEVSGRVARSGRLRDGFIGLRKAYRLGSIAAGTWLMLLPLHFISDTWYEASLIDPHSAITWGWRIALIVCTVLMVGHILLAWHAGGKLRHFFWPIIFPIELFYGVLVWMHRREPMHRQWPPPILLLQGLWRGNFYARTRDAVWNFVMGLRLPYYFWLGFRGFGGALVWLALPVGILVLGANLSAAAGALCALVGGLLLAAVLLYLPFMQAHFAAENRFKAMFQWWTVRMHFRRAPLAFWSALFITLLFALPLYLLKIELTPSEVLWLPALVFVVFMFPARLLSGWAMGRARRRKLPRFFLFRWLARLGAVPVVLTYVFFVYLTQYLSWYGAASMLEQHAFLMPVPFLGI